MAQENTLEDIIHQRLYIFQVIFIEPRNSFHVFTLLTNHVENKSVKWASIIDQEGFEFS